MFPKMAVEGQFAFSGEGAQSRPTGLIGRRTRRSDAFVDGIKSRLISADTVPPVVKVILVAIRNFEFLDTVML